MIEKEINKQVIATMRGIAIDGINNAKGGHMGMAIGAAPISYSIVAKNLNFSSKNPKWINRDKFILSAGHGSMCYYSIMHLLGLLTIEDIKSHKKINSKTPSHPEIDKFKYVDASTGPLGQGIAMGVGMAISQKYLAKRYNKKDFNIIDHYVYVLHGDGCMQEGVALEAIALAGTMQLDKLILIHDFNETQIDSKSYEVNNVDFINYFKANHFSTFDVMSDSFEEINNAIQEAKKSNKPSYIRVHTTIAKNTPYENIPKGHNGYLNENQTIEFKKKCDLNNLIPFNYENDVYDYCLQLMKEKNLNYDNWVNLFSQYKKLFSNEYNELKQLIDNDIHFEFSKEIIKKTNVATCDYCAEILSYLESSPYIIGGSADLKGSTKIGFNIDLKDEGKNIKYGIREFAMSAINNGIYLASNLRTIDSTFLAFSDYAKGALRLGAIMKIPSIHVYSHDSYQVGGDGPTHQPYDQLTMLRSIDNFRVIRPCDESEVLYAFNYALNQNDKQIAIITARQNLHSYNMCDNKAAYVIKKCNNFDISLLASGSEVSLAYELANDLINKNIKAQVISVPILQDLVNDENLIKSLNLDKKPMFVIEAANDYIWYKLSKYNKIESHFASSFGESTSGEEIYKLKGFNTNYLLEKVISFLNDK